MLSTYIFLLPNKPLKPNPIHQTGLQNQRNFQMAKSILMDLPMTSKETLYFPSTSIRNQNVKNLNLLSPSPSFFLPCFHTHTHQNIFINIFKS